MRQRLQSDLELFSIAFSADNRGELKMGRSPLMAVLGLRVRLPVPLHCVRVEGVAWNETRTGGNQNVVEAAIELAAGSQPNAWRIDTFLFQEILRHVEIAFCCCIRCLFCSVLAENNRLVVVSRL